MIDSVKVPRNRGYFKAQAFNSVDTYLAPFVKVDDLSYKEVKQCIQSLVFGLNIGSRWGKYNSI